MGDQDGEFYWPQEHSVVNYDESRIILTSTWLQKQLSASPEFYNSNKVKLTAEEKVTQVPVIVKKKGYDPCEIDKIQKEDKEKSMKEKELEKKEKEEERKKKEMRKKKRRSPRGEKG